MAPKVPSLAPSLQWALSARRPAQAAWVAGSARVQLVEGTPLAGTRRGLGRGCHGSCWPAGAPSPPAAGRALGSSEVYSKQTEPRACEKGGGRPGVPLRPCLPTCPGKGPPCCGKKKLFFLLALKRSLQPHGGLEGSEERRDCRLHPGVLMCVSLGLTFCTPQWPTWSRVARPSQEVM